MTGIDSHRNALVGAAMVAVFALTSCSHGGPSSATQTGTATEAHTTMSPNSTLAPGAPARAATGSPPTFRSSTPMHYLGQFVDRTNGVVTTSLWAGAHTAVGVPVPYSPSRPYKPNNPADPCGQHLVTYSESTTYVPIRATVSFSGAVRTDVHVVLDLNVRGAEAALYLPDHTWACGDFVTMAPGDKVSFQGWVAIEAISNNHPHLTPADADQWAFDAGATGDQSGSGIGEQSASGPMASVIHDDTYGTTPLVGLYARSSTLQWTAGGV